MPVYMKHWRWILLVLIGFSIVMRLTGALLLSASYSRDHTVPCLMVKHISEGTRFPAMYYGQAYLGSLEAYFGAVFYRLPIDKNFACNLGTTVFGLAIIPLIWYWGRRAGGITAGLFSLGLLTIGPPIYMQFMNWSFGAYAALTFFNTAMLVLAMRMVEANRADSSPIPIRWWMAIGFAAGLAWWSGPLVLSGLITVTLLFLFQFRKRCFNWRVGGGVFAFFAGSLPFWLWNMKNDWASLTFISGGTSGSFRKGLVLYAKTMADTAMDSMVEWAWIFGLVLAVAILFGFLTTWRKNESDTSRLYLATALLLVVVAMLFYARKPEQIGPPRYYLPLLPALAVLTGNAIAVLNRKTRLAGWALLIVLLIPQVRFIPVCVKWYAERHEYFAVLDDMRPHFASLDTDIIYADYSIREFGFGMNFYYDEAFCFTEIPLQERMDFYLRRAELESHPAFFNRFRLIHDFLDQTGGTATVFRFTRGFWLTHQLKPNPVMPVAITNGFRITEEISGQDITRNLSDNNRVTYWKNRRDHGGKTLLIDFDEPTDVAKLRLLPEGKFRPILLTVETKANGATQWEPVINNWLLTEWFWSGPRPYAHGAFDRLEAWRPFGHVDAMRITFNDNDTHTYVQVSEIHLFGTGKKPRTSDDSAPPIQPLIDVLVEQGIRHVYADRWDANQLFLHGPTNWMISLDDVSLVKEPRRLPPNIHYTNPLAMISRIENAHITRDVMDRLGLEYSEYTLKPWVVFVLKETNNYMGELPLVWRGVGPQLRPAFDWIDDMCRRAENHLNEGDSEKAGILADKVLSLWPDYARALHVRAVSAEKQGDATRAATLKHTVEQLIVPEHTIGTRFFNGIRLNGIRIHKAFVRPGESLDIKWYWEIPESTDMTAWAIFVHVKDAKGKTVFQADRVLGSDRLNLARTDFQQIVESQAITVPNDIAPGTYAVHAGMYAANPPHKRVGIWSMNRKEFTIRRIILPAELIVP